MQMKTGKKFLKILSAFLLLLMPLFSWAAGGGGGGGGGGTPPPPPCESDTWDCGSWGSCSSSGEQSRTCSLSFDCPTDNKSRPEETQTCTPEPPPYSTPVVSPPPSASSGPSVSPSAPSCTKDEYQCTGWGQCQENGKHNRTCTLRRDCPGVNTLRPAVSEICPGLRCGQLPSLRERISCRLKLSEAEMAGEFKILFIPEACKIFVGDPEEKNECVLMYQNFGPCWKLKVGDERNACARRSLSLGSVAEEKSKCLALPSREEKECLEELHEKVKYMTVFRMYDLEGRAEALIGRGTSPERAVEFDTFVEEKKQELYKSDDVSEWRNIVSEVQAKWKEFIRNIK